MSSITKELLSGSTNGKPIKVAATATPGTTVHTATTSTTGKDEVFLFATNTDSSPRTLTIEFGGVTDPDDLIVKALVLPPNSGPWPIVTGQPLNNGLVIRAFASSANLILISGYVNRIL